jgi:SAM-dependent methyltransferase
MFEGRSLSRSHLDEMKDKGGGVEVSGWMLHPRIQLSAMEILLNGRLVERAAPGRRDDVGRGLPWIAHAALSGFRFALPDARTGDRLEIRGLRGRRVLTTLRSFIRLGLAQTATPPATLMRRVAGPIGEGFFKADGLRCFTEFVDAVGRYRPVSSVKRMLDWGCGCGRVSAHFLADGRIGEIHGCDIDGEATAWCAHHLQPGRFRPIDPYPPTPYPDDFFDLVIGYSVMTHLRRDVQAQWLKEVARILAPGGLFLASVHGRWAAYFWDSSKRSPVRKFFAKARESLFGPPPLAADFSDSTLDAALDGIAPEGYYRGVFQSRRYTENEWSRYFEVLEFIEAGMASYQDLVIMRSRDEK